jgi:energy-coupling factor transporter ATP-binding protein EcfA2
MSREIAIKDVGPIDRLKIDLPPDGGVVVLEGPNGSGKSTAIAAVHALAGGKDELPVRDGRSEGEVAGLGARLVVSRRRTRAGALTVESLDCDLDPSVLADPGIKDPEAADMERARVLCALAGVQAAIDSLRTVGVGCGVDVIKLADAKTLAAKSMPEMAAALKRAIEVEARRQEMVADTMRAKAHALAQSLDGIDLNEPHDEAALAQATETSLRVLARAEADAKNARERRAAWSAAKATLDRSQAIGDVDSAFRAFDAASIASANADRARDESATRTAEAKRALHEAEVYEAARRAEAEACASALRTATAALESAKSAARSVESVRVIVEAGEGDPGPSDGELAVLRAEVESCRKRQERGAVVRAALTKQAEAFEVSEQAAREKAKADAYREAAAEVWPRVAELVDAVRPSGLFLRDGRIYLVTADRGEELFGELSKGERDTIALQAAIAAVGRGGLLPYRQEAWEGLDPEHKAEVARRAKEAGVVVLTAQATEGELRAVPFGDV